MHNERPRQSAAAASGVPDVYHANQNGLGETLLSQYKQC